MIRHIVMWTLHRAEDAPRFKALLDSCATLVPGIHEFDVGVKGEGLAADADVVLVSTFESAAALNAYQQHPTHKAIGAEIAPMRRARQAFDYEIPAAAGHSQDIAP